MDGYLSNLVTKMLDYLEIIRSESEKLCLEKWGYVLSRLDELKKTFQPKNSKADIDDEDDENVPEQTDILEEIESDRMRHSTESDDDDDDDENDDDERNEYSGIVDDDDEVVFEKNEEDDYLIGILNDLMVENEEELSDNEGLQEGHNEEEAISSGDDDSIIVRNESDLMGILDEELREKEGSQEHDTEEAISSGDDDSIIVRNEADLMDTLEEELRENVGEVDTVESMNESDDDVDVDDDDDEVDGETENELNDSVTTPESNPIRENKFMFDKIKKLEKDFIQYMANIPVLGFNSSFYDIGVLKSELFHQLELQKDKRAFLIKKTNRYVQVKNRNFTFLDICQYLGPGCSYSKFLKAYGVKEQKGFFPYDYFDSLSKLDSEECPKQEDFFNKKNNTHISDEDYSSVVRLWNDEKEKRGGVMTFKNYLEIYNSLDVGPFVLGIEEMLKIYEAKNVDLFKTCVSAPGLARRLLFESAHEKNIYFPLFGPSQESLSLLYKAGIVGGPSMTFHRWTKAGLTKIRGGFNICKRIIGWDANALYLWAMGQQMPSTLFVHRDSRTAFKPSKSTAYVQMFIWMEKQMKDKGVHIHHLLNSGGEKISGPYPLDGYDSENDIVYEYNGAWWHGRNCSCTSKLDPKEKENRFKRYREKLDYLKQKHKGVVSIWDCDFVQELKKNPDWKNYIDKYYPKFYAKHKGGVDEEQILTAVMNDDFFGHLEVDISVPESWADDREGMSPWEKFHEMCPIFCNSDIYEKDIGKHMQKYCADERKRINREKGNFFGTFSHEEPSSKPRHLLVGVMKAKKILITSELLKFYLRMGLVITKIHQCVEFASSRCFEGFVREVTEKRRSGDVDPDKAVLGNMYKLWGNSSYGKFYLPF